MSWISDDICWCADSDKCEDIKCYRHMKNRKKEEGINIFTSSCLKGTNLCPSYFSANLNDIYFVKDMRAVRKER